MERSEYNGWTNYETWAVKLWIDNDQGTYEWWLEQTGECVEEGLKDPGEEAALLLAHRLQDHHDEEMEEGVLLWSEACVFTDLLRASLCQVNWYEIAKHMIEEYPA